MSVLYLAPDNAEINLKFQRAENELGLCLIQYDVELPADGRTS